jgi:parvulin-like peptidyl-prolyl isomerase
VVILGLLAACSNQQPGTASAPPTNSTLGVPITVQNAPTDPANGLAATVNGQSITIDTFRRELARWEAGQAALGFQIADQGGYEQQVLDMMIDDVLIRQRAEQQGIVVTDDEVNTVINQMIAETGQEYFDNWLAINYYTLDEFREIMRLSLIATKLTEPVIASVPTTAEHVHARHILVNTEDEANQVMGRLQAGEDFGTLAAEYSVDVTTRENGGDLGWFPRGGLLVPEVEDVAFTLQPGNTSPIVRSAWGYHIIQVLEFDSARPVDEATHQRLVEQTLKDWRLSLRNGAQIEQYLDFSP